MEDYCGDNVSKSQEEEKSFEQEAKALIEKKFEKIEGNLEEMVKSVKRMEEKIDAHSKLEDVAPKRKRRGRGKISEH